MGKFTAALSVLHDERDLHITVCFCDAQKAGKFRTSNKEGIAIISGVEYWAEFDITVLLVACPLALERHAYYRELGYGYDGFVFRPHITLGNGDHVDKYQHLIGETLQVGDEYARTY